MILSKTDPAYRQCAISVLDNIADPDITFDVNGISNYYFQYKKEEKNDVFNGPEGEKKLQTLVDQIKADGAGKDYDCITGISGGVDSSYLVWMAKKWGLRPLIVHGDNGWNSEIAVQNIANIIAKTGFNLYTIVVDWKEFSDLQLAYFKASVVDIEVPTDHAISGTMQKLAAKFKLKYILSGNNVVTEAIMPPSWIYNKNDYINLLDIHKNFSRYPLKTYPLFGFKEQYFYGEARQIKTVKPLNYLSYGQAEAKEIIKKELNWRDYGGKHYESVFTKFYQAYILPAKFKIDKRKAHLSNLIFSGQMTREEAVRILDEPLYSERELQNDKEYVLKKWDLTESEFQEIMSRPRVEHQSFRMQKTIYEAYPALKIFRPLKKLLFKGR